MRKKLQRANKLFLPLDIEASREETKVRLRWHEHWQARNSSKEAEEEVNVPTRIFRVQQVRAALTVHQRLTLPPFSVRYQTPNTIIRIPRAFHSSEILVFAVLPPLSLPSRRRRCWWIWGFRWRCMGQFVREFVLRLLESGPKMLEGLM